MSLGKGLLVGCVLLLGAASAVAQDASTASETERAETNGDRLSLTVTGHAEAIAHTIEFEFVIRGEAEDAVEAEKSYTRKMRRLLKGMPEAAAVTTLVPVEFRSDKHVRVDAFICKLTRANPPVAKEAGTTYSGRFFIEIRDMDKVAPAVARRQLAQVMDKLVENDITGAEDDVDIMCAHMKTDLDALRERSYADAIGRARSRAAVLARLSHRKLGKVTVLREVRSTCNNEQVQWVNNYFNVLYPSSSTGWRASTIVVMDSELALEFELN